MDSALNMGAAQGLRLALESETFRPRDREQGLNMGLAFHRYAVQHDLGAALAPSAPGSQLVTADGKQYGYQPFARDTVVSDSSQWSVVQSLSGMLNGNIPSSGLALDLLAASYRVSGAALHPSWAFHQFAVREQLGPPLAESYAITVSNQTHDIQVFACDTLYSPVQQPGDVRRLSTRSANDPLYQALWVETYKVSGATYDQSSPFQQLAASAALGTPLTAVYQANLAVGAYQVQVFALDTLYATPGSTVQRMSVLPALDFQAIPPPPPAPSPQAGAAQVVQIASAQVGKPYVWGATGPNAFDCSGLMQWCYAQLSITIPRTAQSQYPALTPIDRSQAQPGDLIYFQNMPGELGICHVGMYAGNIEADGKVAMIHAADPALGVQLVQDVFENPYYQRYFAGMRRVAQ